MDHIAHGAEDGPVELDEVDHGGNGVEDPEKDSVEVDNGDTQIQNSYSVSVDDDVEGRWYPCGFVSMLTCDSRRAETVRPSNR